MAKEPSKLSVDPSVAIEDEHGRPVRNGPIIDIGKMRELALMKGEADAASPKDKPVRQLDYELAVIEATPILTVGRAICNVLQNALPKDRDDQGRNKFDGATALEWTEMAFRIIRSAKTGQRAIFSETEAKLIKERVSQGYGVPFWVSQILTAFEPMTD